jgi:hypothetical protein
MLELDEHRADQSAGEHGDFVLHDLAEPVAQQSPVHDVFNRDRDFDKVGAAAVDIEVEAPVRDAAGQGRSAGALLAFGVGASAEH